MHLLSIIIDGLKCLCLFFKAQMLNLVEYTSLLYRAVLPAPVWYRFFLNKAYGSLFSSLMTGLYLTFKLTSVVEKVHIPSPIFLLHLGAFVFALLIPCSWYSGSIICRRYKSSVGQRRAVWVSCHQRSGMGSCLTVKTYFELVCLYRGAWGSYDWMSDSTFHS